MEFEISLNKLSFYAYHGVLETEKKIGNEFQVSITVRIPGREEIAKDNLKDTVSYADLYEIIKEEMSIPRNLLEKVAFEISQRIRKKFKEVMGGRIYIEKVHPPIQNMLGSASVTLNF